MRFKPSGLSTAVLLSLAAIFAGLSAWQMDRSAYKAHLVSAFETATAGSTLPPAGERNRFTRVELAGSFLTGRSFLVDNRIHKGRPGVHVLTPFRTDEAGPLLLINRGWLPMTPDRSALPEIPRPGSPVTVTITVNGHLGELRQPGARLGDVEQLTNDQWPQLVTYPDLDEMGRALGEPVYPEVLFLASDHPDGFAGRNWQPVVMGPGKHKAYALQWAGLSLTAIVAWLILGRLRGKELSK